MGAGDEVPGPHSDGIVTLVNAEEITTEKLEAFDVIMTGIRAYNVLPLLASKQKILLDFVKSGKTMIVQYNTPDSSIPADITIHLKFHVIE
jgi:hypothetical protein